MITVHKYNIEITGHPQVIDSFIRFKPLSVQEQHGKVALWAEVDTLSGHAGHKIHVYGTGLGIPDYLGLEYMDTLQFQGGFLVLHFYLERC